MDPAVTAVGATRGWKVAFGYSDKGSVVEAYVNTAGGGTNPNVIEIPKLANGKADINAISSYLAGFGVVLSNAVKQVIGA